MHVPRAFKALFVFVLAALLISGCGGGGGGTSGGSATTASTSVPDSGGTGGVPAAATPTPVVDPAPSPTMTMSGKIEDATGDPVSGALVVVGSSSATGYTDDQGRFEIAGAPQGTPPLTVLAPGYRARTIAQGVSGQTVRVDEDPSADEAPTVVIESTSVVQDEVRVRARVTASPGSRVVDVRAELLGTQDGAVLTPTGAEGGYTGSFRSSHNGTVAVFAVDDQGRHSHDTDDETDTSASGSGTGADEAWAGSVTSQQGNNDRFQSFNSSITVSESGSAQGIAVFLSIPALHQGQSPVQTVHLTGSARLTGQIYRLSLEDEAGRMELTFSGRLSDDGGGYVGSINGKIDDRPYQASFFFVNTNVRPNPWTATALTAPWGLSFFYKTPASPAPTTYQFNGRLVVDGAGSVLAGTPLTLGPSLATGGSLAFSDVEGQNVGYFVGTPGVVLDNGPASDLYGLMEVSVRHVRGIWKSTPGTSLGHFWGRKNPSWATSDLDAQWQGYLRVTDGPDKDQVLNAQVNINETGEVTGAGSIAASHGGSLTGGNITIGAGTLRISDTTVGALVGTLSGTQQGEEVVVNMSTPSLPETASMGVYHQRLVGRFSISTNGDSGYYFLFRNSNR